MKRDLNLKEFASDAMIGDSHSSGHVERLDEDNMRVLRQAARLQHVTTLNLS